MSQSDEQGRDLKTINRGLKPSLVSMFQSVRVFLTGELDEEAALSRAIVVSLIQIGGVVLTIALVTKGPRWALGEYDFRVWRLAADEAWQRDCLGIAYILLATGIGVSATFAFGWLRRWRPIVSEGLILLTFVVNIVAFSFAMARTGGPAHSFFAQLIPMQLSGILILEEQKAMMVPNTSKKISTRKRAWFYAVLTVLVWLIIVRFSTQFATLFGWKQMTLESSVMTIETVKRFENLAATVLFMLGMFVTAFAYWYTPRLAASFRRAG
jgi:hypothetical protein